MARHLETFLHESDVRSHSGDRGAGLPAFVQRELREYLSCGILCRGFARVHCTDCGKDGLVAFSCKKRGFCPGCCGRRMAETAAHLRDRVLPPAPIRQWVLSLPFRVRYLIACDRRLCAGVRRLFLRTVLDFQRQRAEARGMTGGRSGAVNFIQRFDSALRLNVHFHALVLDGVFVEPQPRKGSRPLWGSRHGEPVFRRLPAPTDEEVLMLVEKIARRTFRWLVRQGVLTEEGHLAGIEEGDEDGGEVLQHYRAAAIQGKVAIGKQAGLQVERLWDPFSSVEAGTQAPRGSRRSSRCADYAGFSLHANVWVAAHRRDRLERLCRYVARPPLAEERLSVNERTGKVVYGFRRPFRDGSTHVALDPLSFLSRLAALVPPPRMHLVTYHGVLAPSARRREQIVPLTLPGRKDGKQPEGDVPIVPAPEEGVLGTVTALLGQRGGKLDTEEAGEQEQEDRRDRDPFRWRRRYSWAELMKRVFLV
ncbi:MAG: transposase, partial [Planctomycetota bacterium]